MAGRCNETCMTEGECSCAPSVDAELRRVSATHRNRMDGRDDPLRDRLDDLAVRLKALTGE